MIGFSPDGILARHPDLPPGCLRRCPPGGVLVGDLASMTTCSLGGVFDGDGLPTPECIPSGTPGGICAGEGLPTSECIPGGVCAGEGLPTSEVIPSIMPGGVFDVEGLITLAGTSGCLNNGELLEGVLLSALGPSWAKK